MPVPNTISVEKLARLIGTPGGPVVVDVRTHDAFETDPRYVTRELVDFINTGRKITDERAAIFILAK